MNNKCQHYRSYGECFYCDLDEKRRVAFDEASKVLKEARTHWPQFRQYEPQIQTLAERLIEVGKFKQLSTYDFLKVCYEKVMG